jgi:O-acetyl-ADP-ribose deacetylase (regulator of RNase III)
MLEIVIGSLLESECRYIAHQCNCHSTRSAGLATAIFKAFPWADVYSDRRQRGNDAALFGSITIHGNPQLSQRQIINIYGQLYPGKPSSGRDSVAARLDAFRNGLARIALIPELTSIGFPYGIGCGLAGGEWNEYQKLLGGFAEQVSVNGVTVILYRLSQ